MKGLYLPTVAVTMGKLVADVEDTMLGALLEDALLYLAPATPGPLLEDAGPLLADSCPSCRCPAKAITPLPALRKQLLNPCNTLHTNGLGCTMQMQQ